MTAGLAGPALADGAAGIFGGHGSAGPSANPAISPAGSYTFHVNGAAIAGAINANGTWNVASDHGLWAQAGAKIALDVTSGNAGDVGCVFVGKILTTGIGTASAPGDFTCPGSPNPSHGTWYATKP